MSIKIQVYKITDAFGKIYIGQTSRSIAERLTCHRARARANKKSALYDSIRANPNMKAELLDIAASKEAGDFLEESWIAILETEYPKGLNMYLGGAAGGRKGKKAMENCIRANNLPRNKEVYRTPEFRKKVSDRMTGEGNHRFGLPTSEETKRKMSLKHKGRANDHCKIKVMDMVTGNVYESVRFFCRSNNIPKRTAYRSLCDNKASPKHNFHLVEVGY